MKKDDQIFTKEQLLKVNELSKSFPSEEVAVRLQIKPGQFTALKKQQPAIREAYNKGAEVRRLKTLADKRAGKKRALKLIKPQERKVSIESDLENNALQRFNEQFAKDKERELKKQLNEIESILL